MNIYHCMIELKDDARALGFAAAVDAWMSYLKARGLIRDWRLMRRKLGLASSAFKDFALEVNITSLSALDDTFSVLSHVDAEAEQLYDRMHKMIAEIEVGLFRGYPDPTQRERIALI
jgi:hypothetical protein